MRNEARSTQRKPELAHVILTLLGITGLVLFVLACRPSWSPDGQRVLYSYWDDGAKTSAVAVFDRKTRTSRVMFKWWDETRSDPTIAGVQWTKDGEKAIVTIYEEEGVQLLALPVNAQKSVQAYTLKKMDDAAFLPFPEAGNKLFVMGGKMRARVNLETGEIFRRETEEKADCLLYDAGSKVFYLAEAEKKAAEAKQAKEKDESKTQADTPDIWEFGELDQKDLSLHPWLRLRSDELKAKGIGEFTGQLDVDRKSLKIAASEEPLEGKPARILVIGKSGIEQILEVGIKDKPYKLGNPQWSRDGKKVFVSAAIEDEKAKKAEFAVVELSLDGKSSRTDRIEAGPAGEFDSDYLAHAQIALSPDGKLIAVTNGHLKDVRPERRGLFLLDVSRADRPVNFYAAPALPAVPKAAKE